MDLIFAGWQGTWVLVFYGLVILGIGLFASFKHKQSNETLNDYFLGGRNLGLVILFFTFMASQYSGNTFIGMAPKAYRIGFAWFQFVTCMMLAVSGVLMYAPKLYPLSKKLNFITPTDWIEHRFKSPWISIIASLIFIYAMANFVLAQFVAIGQAISGLTAGTIPYQVGVLYFVIIMLIYSWAGGLRSVAYVDFFQGLILSVGALVLIIGTFIVAGDLAATSQYIATNHIEKIIVPTTETLMAWASLLLLVGIAIPMYPFTVQRVFAAEKLSNLKQSLINLLWVPLFVTSSTIIVGLISIKTFPNLEKLESEKLIGMMANLIASENMFFYVTMIFFFGALISAMISTADSALLSITSIISKDIYSRHINPTASDKKKIYVGKMLSAILVAGLLYIAWNPPATLIEILIIKVELLAQVFPAFVLSIYLKKLSSKAVLAGLITGSLLTILLVACFKVKTFLGLYSGIWGLALNTIIVLSFSKSSPSK